MSQIQSIKYMAKSKNNYRPSNWNKQIRNHSLCYSTFHWPTSLNSDSILQFASILSLSFFYSVYSTSASWHSRCAKHSLGDCHFVERFSSTTKKMARNDRLLKAESEFKAWNWFILTCSRTYVYLATLSWYI